MDLKIFKNSKLDLSLLVYPITSEDLKYAICQIKQHLWCLCGAVLSYLELEKPPTSTIIPLWPLEESRKESHMSTTTCGLVNNPHHTLFKIKVLYWH